MRDIFVQPSGQDDNLGDSALRVGLMHALRGEDTRLHVHLEGQSSDYHVGIPLRRDDQFYSMRRSWLLACKKAERPVFVVNAGEINPPVDLTYPNPKRVAELRAVTRRGGVVIAAGIGLKEPANASRTDFDPSFREALIVSWRDHGSRDAAGFGDVAPDWAFALGADCARWAPHEARRYLAVTLRFDRPWPDEEWLAAVRSLAARTETKLVTVAQVARDQPRAVALARALGGEYLVAPSTSHRDFDTHVRSVYANALAVVSDRAHALIMGATEGAYPIGTAVDPQKIRRLLDTAGIGALTGTHSGFHERALGLEAELVRLSVGVTASRRDLDVLTERIRTVIEA